MVGGYFFCSALSFGNTKLGAFNRDTALNITVTNLADLAVTMGTSWHVKAIHAAFTYISRCLPMLIFAGFPMLSFEHDLLAILKPRELGYSFNVCDQSTA